MGKPQKIEIIPLEPKMVLRGGAVKRLLWCRWFHRWQLSPYGGETRRFCRACKD